MSKDTHFEKSRIQNLNFEFNLQKLLEHIVYLAIITFIALGIIHYFNNPINILAYIALVYISFLIIYYWSDVNRIIIYSVLGNKVDYYKVYNSRFSEDFINAAKEHQAKHNVIAYYLNILEEHKDFDIVNNNILIKLLKLEKNVGNKHKINLFFLVSFFSLNIFYSIMILSIIHLTKELDILSFFEDKFFIIIVITAAFGFTIYIFLKSFSFFHDFISEVEIDKNMNILNTIEIYPKDINLSEIKRKMSDIKLKIEERESSTFQVAIPVFYLGYVSLAISYFE